MKALLDDVSEVRRDDPFAKFVVFSKYQSALHAVREMLSSLDLHQPGKFGAPFKCVLVDSTSGHAGKEYSLRAFNDDPECNFCLLHTPSCGTGLTLTVASCLYMLEPEENAALEAQVISRVHRIGQLKNVRCVVFFGRKTWEERLLYHRQSEGKLTEVLAVRTTHIFIYSHSTSFGSFSHSILFSAPTNSQHKRTPMPSAFSPPQLTTSNQIPRLINL